MSNKLEKAKAQNSSNGKGKGKKKQAPKPYQMSILPAFGGELAYNMVKSDHLLIPTATADDTTPKQKIKVKQKRKKVPGEALAQNTFRAFCSYPQNVGQVETAAKLLLLVLLSQVFHLLAELLPSIPILLLKTSSQTVSAVIGPLITAIQGPEEWSGKKWQLKRPWIIRPKLSPWETRPSSLPMSYLGGRVRVSGKKWREFYFPFISSSMVLMPNLPAEISKQIVTISPLAMPILLQPMKLDAARPVIELEPQSFDVYDESGIKALQSSAKSCRKLVVSFLSWFCEGDDNIRRLTENMNYFRPVTRTGRFIQYAPTDDAEFLCAGLAFFGQFLRFAHEVMSWISLEEAVEILLQYWRWVLPESAPPEERSVQNENLDLTYDTAGVFYQFLAEDFLPTYRDQVLHAATGTQETMGLLRKIGNGDVVYFITPRARFLECYAQWLEKQHVAVFKFSANGGGAAAQRKLLEAGVPLKGESGNPATWRFKFYGTSAKVDCFGLPIAQLPEAVQNVFGLLFGIGSGSGITPTHSEADPDSQKGAEAL